MQPTEAAKRAPRRGSRTSGSLPVWIVEDATKTIGMDMLRVTCPRCDQFADVADSWLTSQPDYQTRSCTYCSKTARLPSA